MHHPEKRELERELEAFDPALTIDAARTPPASWYRRPDVLALEARSVFRGNFLPVGRSDQVDGPGRYFTGHLLEQPYVVLRDAAGALAAFHNVCRHHGAEVARDCGELRALVCPYHAWTYDLGGRLVRAPRAAGVESRPDPPALPPIRVAEWGPLVFLDLGGEAPPLTESLAPFAQLCDADSLRALRFVCRKRYELACNWKLYVENYLDGGYHVGHLHRGLAGQLDLASYRTEIHPHLALQTCSADVRGARGSELDFRERLGAGAVYAWVHPNLMLNRYGPVLDINIVLPLGPERCEVIFDYWFEPELCERDPAFVERSLAASDRVQQEDIAICESVQRGLASSAYERGWYAPEVEGAMLHFHRLLAAELGRAGADPRDPIGLRVP